MGDRPPSGALESAIPLALVEVLTRNVPRAEKARRLRPPAAAWALWQGISELPRHSASPIRRAEQ
jgi:hypothetical protein